MADGTGTSGGWRGMNGAQRQIALAVGGGFLLILAAIMVANAESMASEFAAAHVPVSAGHVWIWEASSIFAWLTLTPAIWWTVARLRRAAPPWWAVALIVIAATVPASLWHIGLMWGIRAAVYALQGQHYRLMGGIEHPILYEYRKDVATVLQFAAVALGAQWLIARAATPPPSVPSPRTLAVNDGAVTHHVPLDEIERVSSAGNYVEIGWGPRILLQRTTLAAAEAELGDRFVRIHRRHLVRRDAIRRIEADKSGDFTVDLASGAQLRGSRRYRDAL